MEQEKQSEERVRENRADLKPVAFWQLHKNPILLRYMRSRLRWSSIAASLVITLVITIFTFAITYTVADELVSNGDVYDFFRACFLPLFVIQVLIMMFIGTGSVANGIIQEYDDGMIDYQRLSPMSPMAKIVGYLFGLPIREWFLFGVTSIFIGIIVYYGKIPWSSIWRVYSVFFLSIILYHLIALVVVHSMKKKRVAGKGIQFVVLVLYIVFPLLSQFGLVFFEYLTVRPILKEHILDYIPEEVGMRRFLDLDGSSASVPFFDYQFKSWGFSIMLMSSLIISFLFMLTRKWKDVTSHLMSKPFALVFFGFFMLFLIGNTLPIAKEGEMSVTRSFRKTGVKALEAQIASITKGTEDYIKAVENLKEYRNTVNVNSSLDAPIAQTVFGAVCLSFACMVVYIVTPQNEKYLLGLRRARNLKKRWIPFHWDESSGLLATLLVASMMAGALYIFSTTLYTAPMMSVTTQKMLPFLPMVCLYAALVVIVFYLVYEAWENKGLFLLILFVWVLPLLVATVVAVRTSNLSSVVWISSVSPLAAYGYGMSTVTWLPVRAVFYFSFIVQGIIGAFAVLDLISKKLNAKKALLENTID